MKMWNMETRINDQNTNIQPSKINKFTEENKISEQDKKDYGNNLSELGITSSTGLEGARKILTEETELAKMADPENGEIDKNYSFNNIFAPSSDLLQLVNKIIFAIKGNDNIAKQAIGTMQAFYEHGGNAHAEIIASEVPVGVPDYAVKLYKNANIGLKFTQKIIDFLEKNKEAAKFKNFDMFKIISALRRGEQKFQTALNAAEKGTVNTNFKNAENLVDSELSKLARLTKGIQTLEKASK